MTGPTPQVIYIAGFARSGSTLLGELIAAGGQAFHVGELLVGLHRLATREGRLCSCGAELVKCPVWGNVLEAFPELRKPSPQRARTLATLIQEPLVRPKRTSAEQLEIAEAATAIYSRIALVTGAARVVDSSKSPAFGGLVRAQTLHLVRDPRAVVYSRLRSARQRGRLSSGVSKQLLSVVADSRRWATVNRAQRTTGVSAAALRYEDLVSLRTMPPEIGLDLDWEGFSHRPSTNHLIWGNGAFRKSTPREIRYDNAWEAEMTTWQKAVIDGVTARELRHYPTHCERAI